ncbi:MAG: DUF2306 domain-containing protein [Bacteroidota bacterium]
MLEISLQYIPFDTDVAFLRIKQDYIELSHYKLAFFTHVYSSFFCLLAAFTQFSPYVRKRLPQVHRQAGWLYALSILVFAAPSGFVIGIYANGGLGSQIAFCLLAILWIYFTAKAIWAIKNRNIMEHRYFMIRSFALTLSAITLRAWKYIIVAIFHPRPMDVYQIVAWLGWVLNLILAEYIIYRLKK